MKENQGYTLVNLEQKMPWLGASDMGKSIFFKSRVVPGMADDTCEWPFNSYHLRTVELVLPVCFCVYARFSDELLVCVYLN